MCDQAESIARSGAATSCASARTAAQRRGEGAIQEGAADAQQALIGDLARRLDELAVGPGDVAADVVLAEVQDGAARALAGGRPGGGFAGSRGTGDA